MSSNILNIDPNILGKNFKLSGTIMTLVPMDNLKFKINKGPDSIYDLILKYH